MRRPNSFPLRLFENLFSTKSAQSRSVVERIRSISKNHTLLTGLCSNPTNPSTPVHTSRMFPFHGISTQNIRTMTTSSSSNTGVSPMSTAAAVVTNDTQNNSDDDKNNKTAMDDEYGDMNAVVGHTYVYPGPFRLESGIELPKAQLRYMTYGTLNPTRDNVVVVCHALTGNANVHTWWGNMIGPGQALDTQKYFIVCANILGSCYGSTGPASTVSTTQGDKGIQKYGMAFPDVSVQDTVRLQLHMLQDELKVSRIKCVIGGSFGGMQALEFAVQAGTAQSPFAIYCPRVQQRVPWVQSVIPMACGAAHTAWQIAISEVQRQAIYADPKWKDGNPCMDDPPLSGLAVARQIGMISYRTPKAYEMKFGRRQRADDETEDTRRNTGQEVDPVEINGSNPSYGSMAQWQVKSYLEYQGSKFLSRFDPITYIKLTEQMDSHDVGRNRGGKQTALAHVKIPALVMGIDSDVLYPLWEQEELATLLPNCIFKVIHSDAGHDGFLLEQEQVASHITSFLNSLGLGGNQETRGHPTSKL
jgi:homoserine O-acetyltransferase